MRIVLSAVENISLKSEKKDDQLASFLNFFSEICLVSLRKIALRWCVVKRTFSAVECHPKSFIKDLSNYNLDLNRCSIDASFADI